MRKLITLLICLFLIQTVTAFTLKQGESEEFKGKTITAKFIQESKVVMEVDNEKNILTLGQTKTINGVIIEITDLFYSGTESTVSFNAKLNYECGDLVCNEGEDYSSCCQDCECPLNEKCISSGCILPECFLDEDCKDKSALTDDSCKDYKCEHREKNCKNHEDCNDNNPETDDFCHEGKCQNLQNWICKADSDCESNNPCILSQCINKDCQYKKIEDCKTSEKLPEKPAETTLKFTDESHPGLFKRFFNWLKNLFSL